MCSEDPSRTIVPNDLPDAHTHLTCSLSPDGEQVFSFPCLLNSSRPADWEAVADIARTHLHVIPAYGIHPWYLDEATAPSMGRLIELLESDPTATIGEVGLDKAHRPSAPMDLQIRVLEQHLIVAKEYRRTISLHCVRAWGHLLDSLQRIQPGQFLLHGWQGPAELVPSLIELGAHFSLGIRQLTRPGIVQALSLLPPNRIHLESEGHPTDLSSAWQQWSHQLDTHPNLPYPSSPPDRLSLLRTNFNSLKSPSRT